MTSYTRIVRASLAFTLTLGAATHAVAQGYSYDVSTSGTDPRNNTTVVMSASHGRWMKGFTRMDIVSSPARGGMMGTGTYMISVAGTGITTFVDPIKKQYYEMNVKELGAQAAEMQSAVSGVAKMEVVDVHVDMEELGAGEPIEGYATLKYRLTQNYTMRMTVMGHANDTKEHNVSEIWVAPELSADLNPNSRPAASTNAMMQALTDAVAKAYAKVKPGVMLRMVNTSAAGAGAKARNHTTTMTVSNFKHESFASSVFQVPSGYTKIDSPFDALNAAKKP
ncbi:MAG: hypothetical protein ABJB66_07765 [Gemmatimonadaceae bacterium]